MTGTILLDTCAALWIMDNAWMRQEAVDAVDDAFDRGERIRVSPITGWELGLAASRGRFKSNLTPRRWLDALLACPEFALAELTPRVLLEATFLPDMASRDPADRIIAATAREYGYTVMTRDKALLDYGREGHLSVLEC